MWSHSLFNLSTKWYSESMAVNNWKCLFLFSALHLVNNWFSKVQKFPSMCRHILFLLPTSFLPFYHFSNENVLKLMEEEKENKKCMKKMVVLKPKGTKKKIVLNKRALKYSIHLLLSLQDNSRWKIYLFKAYLLHLLCKPYIICTVLFSGSQERKICQWQIRYIMREKLNLLFTETSSLLY